MRWKPRTQSTTGLLGGAKFGGSESCHRCHEVFQSSFLKESSILYIDPILFFTSLSCSLEKNPGRCLASVIYMTFFKAIKDVSHPLESLQAFLTVPLQWYVLLSAGTLRPKVSEVHLHPMGSLGQLGRVNLLVARFVKSECETHEPPKCSDLRKASIDT